MPAIHWLLFALSISLWPLTLSWQIARRLRQKEDRAAFPALIQSPRLWVTILCTFVCTLGALWLFPWAAHLPAAEPWGLLSGLGFVALIAVSILYAQRIGSIK